MKKVRNLFAKHLRYFCLIGVVGLGLTTIIATGGGGGDGDVTNDIGDVLSHFDSNSYLPIVENATWTYNYGSTVMVTNVNTTNNTFDIINVGISGSMAGIGGQDSIGNYISFSGFVSPEFLPIRNDFGFRPLLYEDF